MSIMLHLLFLTAEILLAIYVVFDLIYFFINYYLQSPIKVPSTAILESDVTIQIPIFNTGDKIYPLLNSIKSNKLNYPIQLLDSSSDQTTVIIEEFFGPSKIIDGHKFWIKKWENVELIHFKKKDGLKAWALNEGTLLVSTPFIAIFDSDWEISSDFFKTLLPIIKSDPNTGYVQASWQSINEDENILAYTDAVSVESEHLVEDVFRGHFKIPFTIHGSAFIVRSQLVRQLLWRNQFLSEDIDLALRINLSGYHGVYVKEQKSFGRTCSTFHEFYRQKARWIEGRSQMLRIHGIDILKSESLPLLKKLFVLHYLSYFIRYPLFAVILLMGTTMSGFHLIPGLILLSANIFSRVLVNLRTISFKKKRKHMTAVIEPILFWICLIPFSIRATRGLFLRKAAW